MLQMGTVEHTPLMRCTKSDRSSWKMEKENLIGSSKPVSFHTWTVTAKSGYDCWIVFCEVRKIIWDTDSTVPERGFQTQLNDLTSTVSEADLE